MNIKHAVVALAVVVGPLCFFAFRPVSAPVAASKSHVTPVSFHHEGQTVETVYVTIVGHAPAKKATKSVTKVSCKVRSLLTDYAAQVRTCDSI